MVEIGLSIVIEILCVPYRAPFPSPYGFAWTSGDVVHRQVLPEEMSIGRGENVSGLDLGPCLFLGPYLVHVHDRDLYPSLGPGLGLGLGLDPGPGPGPGPDPSRGLVHDTFRFDSSDGCWVHLVSQSH